MRRAFRIALKLTKWLAIAGVSIYLLLVLVNLPDEALTAEERALAEPNRPAVPDSQNIYVALLGFYAPPGIDSMAYGAKRLAQHNEAAAKDPWRHDRVAKLRAGQPIGEDKDTLKWIDGGRKLPSRFEGPILPNALGQAQDVTYLLEANVELIARYRTLQSLPQFSNTAVPDILSPVLLLGAPADARSVLLAQCAIDALSGRSKRALEFLTADISLWRRVLAGSGTLIDEMRAITYLAGDFRLVSDLISSREFDAFAHRATLASLTTPLTKPELGFGQMFANEFQENARLLSSIDDEEMREAHDSWLSRAGAFLFYFPFFKLNATLNRSAHAMTNYQRLAGLAPSDYLLAKADVKKESEAMADFGLTWLYNPIGKGLVGVAAIQYEGYVDRLPDLDAYIHLVRAQLEVRLASVPSEKVPQFLEKADAESWNPYTNRPFQWSPTAHSLMFDAVSQPWRKWGTTAVLPLQ